jgi:formylmethanofuran dehydrogenase subunit E
MNKLICGMTPAQFLEHVAAFHGYPAPGLVVGAYMVDAARRYLPEGTLFEALCETASCLPDAVQLFTPCTVGNGWLRIKNLGRYALTLYDKHTGEGFRAHLDPAKLGGYPEIAAWFLKTKAKKDQDSDQLRRDMFTAGETVLTVRPVTVGPGYLGKNSKGAIAVCPACGEAYPASHGTLCLGCRGEAPWTQEERSPKLKAVSLAEAVGAAALHDMTRVVPGVFKDVAVARGHVISGSDVCQLQRMGRMRVYVDDGETPGEAFVHEDDAARGMAGLLCARKDLKTAGGPKEGKITLRASRSGLLTVDVARLAAVNALGEVALSTRHHGTVVATGEQVAGVRAIPLYLPRDIFEQACALLHAEPVLAVRPLRSARAGALVTGTEVFTGLIEDKFAQVIRTKLAALGSKLVETRFAPDDALAIEQGVRALLDAGCDLIVTTAGMSVDPDDVTRKGLTAAGAEDVLFGTPVLPGNMTLLARIGQVPVMGVPACALFHKRTSLDILLPMVLAGLPINRASLAALGHGGFCMNCRECSYPRCSFGKESGFIWPGTIAV